MSRVNISNFRNLGSVELQPASGVNLIVGDNGSGKTSILEAIFYSCTARSFKGAPDRVLQLRGADVSRVVVLGSIGTKKVEVAIAWGGGEKKQVKVDGVKLIRLADLFDYFHAVSFVPEDADVILGPPSQRRRLLDLYISQADRSYLRDLLEYNRVLAQRNALLKDFNFNEESGQQLKLLSLWDDQLAPVAGRIVEKRISFLSFCSELIKEYYRRIVAGGSLLTWEYDSPAAAGEETASTLGRKLRDQRRRDLHLGTTSVGPHRDDVVISLDGVPLRAYASQGEAKSAALAIKFAVYDFLSRELGERPLLLLDELSSQLDRARAASLLQILPDLGQVFITTARRDEVPKELSIEAEVMIADGHLLQ